MLKSLIQQSSLPLTSIETEFAVDSSGFATTTYHRWFDHKWGKEIKEAEWVKAHRHVWSYDQHSDGGRGLRWPEGTMLLT